MKDETLDLQKMTVEDLFQAKAERRQRLANLPFEKKIEIVRAMGETVSDRTCRALAQQALRELGITCRMQTRSQPDEKGAFHCVVQLMTDDDEDLFSVHTQLAGRAKTLQALKTRISAEWEKQNHE